MIMLAGVVMLIGAWYLPALAVVMMPGAFHLALANPSDDAAVVAAYLVLVATVRLLLRFEIGKDVAPSGISFPFRIAWRTSSKHH